MFDGSFGYRTLCFHEQNFESKYVSNPYWPNQRRLYLSLMINIYKILALNCKTDVWATSPIIQVPKTYWGIMPMIRFGDVIPSWFVIILQSLFPRNA